jgi:hypothetical protein
VVVGHPVPRIRATQVKRRADQAITEHMANEDLKIALAERGPEELANVMTNLLLGETGPTCQEVLIVIYLFLFLFLILTLS